MNNVLSVVGLVTLTLALTTCAPSATHNLADDAFAIAEDALTKASQLESRIDDLESRLDSAGIY